MALNPSEHSNQQMSPFGVGPHSPSPPLQATPVERKDDRSPTAPPGWLLFPREHGAWGMVGLPFLAASAIALGDPFTRRTAAAACAVLFAFLLRDPLVTLRRSEDAIGRPEAANQRLTAKRSFTICLGGLALSGTIMMMTLPPFWVLLLGISGLALVISSVVIAMARVQREITSQLLSVAGLTASCLPAYLAVHRDLDWSSIIIWSMSAAHSIAAVLVVRARLETILMRRRTAAASGPGRFFRAAVVWQFGLWICLAAMAWIGYPLLALPFLLPSLLHVWELLQFRRGDGLQVSLHRVGWSQLIASVLFYTALVFLFRLQIIA